LSILSVLGGFLAHQLLKSYQMFAALPGGNLWRREAIFIALTMVLSGIISVLNWDKLFLDFNDYHNLLTLPLRLRTLLLAKFVSLLAYAFIVATVFNLCSSAVFVLYPATKIPVFPLWSGVGHYLANLLGSIVIFFGVALLQSLLIIFFNREFYRKIASLFQAFLLFLMIAALFLVPNFYSLLAKMNTLPSSLPGYLPPLWFVGIYDQMIGYHHPFINRLIPVGLILAILFPLLYLLMSPFTLKRYLHASGNSEKKFKTNPLVRLWGKVFNGLFLRHPVERGVFYFYIKTLKRSRSHLLKLTLYLAIPLGFFIIKVVSISVAKGLPGFREIDPELLAIPLLLHLALVLGWRSAVEHPVDLKANWLFRLAPLEKSRHYLMALKKALFFTGVLPVVFLFYPFYHLFWGMKNALYHSFFCLAIALLLREIVFLHFKKIPFTVESSPGKNNLMLFWPLYLVTLVGYYNMLSQLALALLSHPRYYMIFYTVVLGIYTGLNIYRHLKEKERVLVFEEEPESVMLTLGFDPQ
jgi:hypothetical protein